MREGAWDNKFVVHVGTIALNSNQMLPGNNERTAHVLSLVARYPLAAAELYSANFDKIQQMLHGTQVGWIVTSNPKLGDPLGTFITAATVNARKLYERLRPVGATNWRNPAEELTRRLLLDLEANKPEPDDNGTVARTPRPFAGVTGAYTAIATEYYDDLHASVGGPPIPAYFEDSDPSRSGVEAPASAWSELAQLAMWEPKNAAILNTFFNLKDTKQTVDVVSRENPDHPFANNMAGWQNGQVAGWFVAQLEAVKKQRGDAVKKYNAEVKVWVDRILDPANAALFATGGVKASATAAGQALIASVKSTGLDAAKKAVASWFEQDPPNYVNDTKWGLASETW